MKGGRWLTAPATPNTLAAIAFSIFCESEMKVRKDKTKDWEQD
jgi:hypothetical protein